MTRRGLLLFAAMCVIWGIPYLFIRVAVGELSPPTLVFFRTSLAALVLLPFALSQGGLGAVRGKWVPLLFFAGFEVALPWLLLSSAEQHISSALAGLLISAVPLYVALPLLAMFLHGAVLSHLPGTAARALAAVALAAPVASLALAAPGVLQLVEPGQRREAHA